MAGWGMTVRLTGLEDLHARLETMKQGVRNVIVRGAMKKAAAPIKKAVKANLTASKKTGLLNKSIAVKERTYASGTVIVVIGPKADVREQVDVSGLYGGAIFRQMGGVKGKRRRGKWTPGIFGRTLKITKPRGGKSKTWPTMIRNPVKYAHLVEKGLTIGGKKRRAKPFLMPAFDSTKAEAERIFREHVENKLMELGIP